MEFPGTKTSCFNGKKQKSKNVSAYKTRQGHFLGDKCLSAQFFWVLWGKWAFFSEPGKFQSKSLKQGAKGVYIKWYAPKVNIFRQLTIPLKLTVAPFDFLPLQRLYCTAGHLPDCLNLITKTATKSLSGFKQRACTYVVVQLCGNHWFLSDSFLNNA